MACKLACTVKAHKAAGDVCLRPLHSASKYSYSGLSKWTGYQIHCVLQRYSHICHSTDAFLRGLSQVVLDQSDVFLHWDLDNFYMTGDHPYLNEHVGLLMPLSRRQLVKQSLSFLLSQQFIKAMVPRGTLLCRMVRGAVQGLPHAGSSASAAFAHAVELQGLGLATTQLRSRLQIKYYRRLADNLFFVIHRDKLNELLHLLASLPNSTPYSGKIEECSDQTCSIFDVRVFKGPRYRRCGRIDYEPIFRNNGAYLSIWSAHFNAVHLSWPRAYISRLALRSSSDQLFRVGANEFVDRLIKQNWPSFLITTFRDMIKFEFGRMSTAKTAQRRQREILWHSFAFHPLLARKGFAHRISAFCDKPASKALISAVLDRSLKIRVAWRLVSAPHNSTLVVH